MADQIRTVFALAYTQEAELLQVRNLASFERTASEIQQSDEFFLGAIDGNFIVGTLSLGPDDEPGQISISSLVVHPSYQRRGIGRSLLAAALQRATGFVLSVATGMQNKPALQLYQEFGFVSYRNGVLGPENLEIVKLRASAP
ncbi:GNAT family N-acetyltransferase [Rubrivivax sp. A210]|uniref:GNAT family N-acetyltransferase n=1 Tax=Rubrivivax sp. A210 TaxID=2772301 RepID=UPI001918CEC7|nr:GNAT family N-acetyltransferase [Rubrivivax sp. A210]